MFSADKVKINKVDFERLKESALKAYMQHSLYATVSKQREIISQKDDEILELKKELHQKNKFFDKYSLNGLYEKFKQNEIEREIERYRKQIKREREKENSYEISL